jgi:hypothetical protein
MILHLKISQTESHWVANKMRQVWLSSLKISEENAGKVSVDVAAQPGRDD